LNNNPNQFPLPPEDIE